MGTPFDFRKVTAEAQQHEDGIRVVVVDEHGAPYDPPFTITVAGMLSKRVRVAQSRNAMAYANAQGDEPDADKALDAAAEVVQMGTIEVAARATIAWDGLTADGEAVPCTIDNARALYAAAPEVHGQVLRAMRSRDAAFRAAGGAADGADDAHRADGAAEREQDDTGAPAKPRTARGQGSGGNAARAGSAKRGAAPVRVVG
jgi:hypothetical protein